MAETKDDTLFGGLDKLISLAVHVKEMKEAGLVHHACKHIESHESCMGCQIEALLERLNFDSAFIPDK
jgi:hypothetical protein